MLTKQWTSFVGFGLGDTVAQLVTEGSLDPTRTAILALYGWLVDAPCGNAFYSAAPRCSAVLQGRIAAAADRVALAWCCTVRSLSCATARRLHEHLCAMCTLVA